MNAPESFALDGLPPTTNHSYGLHRDKQGRARMHSTVEKKAWQEAAILRIQAGRAQPHQDWTDRSLLVLLTFYCVNRNRDIDGGVKIVLDALAAALGFNDREIMMLMVQKCLVLEKAAEATAITLCVLLYP